MDALGVLRADPARTALFLDFDGTLAPIVAVAADARPLPGTADTLVALTERYAVVAVVSGRPLAFLGAHLPSGVERHGLYGLETAVGDAADVHPAAAAWRPVVDDVAGRGAGHRARGARRRAQGPLPHAALPTAPGSRRGRAALGDGRRGAVGAAAPDRQDVRRAPPAGRGRQGHRGVVAGGGDGAVAYVGDDVGDLPAFAALDVLRTAGVSTVKVAVHTDETSPGLVAGADLQVDGPQGALAFLEALLT